MKPRDNVIGLFMALLLCGCSGLRAQGLTESKVKEDIKKTNEVANAEYDKRLWNCSSGAKLVLDSVKISEIKVDSNEATAHVAVEQHLEKTPPPKRTKDSISPVDSNVACWNFKKPPTTLYGKMLYRKYDSEWRLVSVQNE